MSRPRPAYHRTPFESVLNAEVVDKGASDGHAWIVTDDTVLYPGGGGQPADRGTVAGVDVRQVSWSGTGWRHELAGGAPPAVDGPVEIVLDWTRRFDHMQQHTAQHLLSALAQDRWGWATTAFHMGEERSDIELATPSVGSAEMDALEEAVMEVVREARPIESRYVSVEEYRALGTRSRGLPESHEGDVRLVEIGGVDLTACGGTHLASTSQIESLKLLATESMRGGTRLHWVAGRRLRQRLGTHEERNDLLRRVLGVADDELVSQAESRLEQLRQADRRTRELETRLAQETAAAVAQGGGQALDLHLEGMNAQFLKAVGQHLQPLLGDRVALLTAEAEGAGAFLLVRGDRSPLDMRTAGQRVAELLEGRGGGAGAFFQGRAGSLEGREAALAALVEALGD